MKLKSRGLQFQRVADKSGSRPKKWPGMSFARGLQDGVLRQAQSLHRVAPRQTEETSVPVPADR